MGLDFALRCAAAEHEVRLFQWSKTPVKDGRGFRGIKIIDDWRASMAWAKDGLVVMTGNTMYVREIDRFRDLGFKVFGPTVASANLEIQRSAGLEAMEAAGIDVPPYKTFTSLESAQAHARKMDECFVFKTMGSEDDKSLSYVSCDPADLVGWLQVKIDRGMKLKGPCMLQQKIDMEDELGVSGWFGPDGFLPGKWQICFEHKKLMPGEIGPNTGEQGTVCQYVETDKLANEMLVPMVGALRKAGHRGDFAIGAGIDKNGKAWPFEFTARLGWPAFFIQVASHRNNDPAQWMHDLLAGKDTLKVSGDVAMGVVCAQPNYPYNKSPPDLVEGNPISGVEAVWDDIHPVGMMIGKGPKMKSGKVVDARIPLTTGEYVLVATGLGKTVSKAMSKVYKTVKAVRFPNMMYRNDIGASLEETLPALHKHGYATEMVFE